MVFKKSPLLLFSPSFLIRASELLPLRLPLTTQQVQSQSPRGPPSGPSTVGTGACHRTPLTESTCRSWVRPSYRCTSNPPAPFVLALGIADTRQRHRDS